jgi:uncharacterized circularly permuted ATP-grasp superfamily protein
VRPFTDGYDEAFAAPDVPRPHYAELIGALEGVDLADLRSAVNHRVRSAGVRFGNGAGARPFVVDPIPRILSSDEWSALAAGLEQRVRALNAFVADAYGERRIVDAGWISEEVIESAEGYEPDLCRVLPAGAPPIGIAGLDIVRDRDGTLSVLEDNVRTPSGFTYAVAARRAVQAELNIAPGHTEDLCEPLIEVLAAVLRGAAPDGGDGEPSVVVLSDGPSGSAWYEHAETARLLDVPVVTPADLERRGDRLHARLEDGRLHAVDVVYRRCDEDRLRDGRGALTPIAEALLGPWLAGHVAVVNAFGAGVADDKLVHGHVDEMIRFYLSEEPLLQAVPTLDLGRRELLDDVLRLLKDFVVKPRMGHGGVGVVICAHAEDETLERLRAELAAGAGQFVAQPTVAISHHPTVVEGRLEPRHVDLRPFIFSTASGVRALPGGLTRVAWDPGALVVNSSQNGGAKDTWVLR